MWSKQSGTLPPGLSLSSGGALSGTPTTAGTYAYVVAATDNAGTVATRSESITIAYATLTLTGTYTASDQILTAYSSDLAIAGGNGVYSNPRATAGTLPAGLSLSIVNVSGAYKLRLSGTPTTVATYSFTAAVDSGDGQTATSAQSVTITADPTALSIYNKIAVAGGGQGEYWDLTEASGNRAGSANGNNLSVTGTNGTETGPRGSGDLAWYAGSANIAYLTTSRTINDGLDVPASSPGPQNYCLFGWMKFHANTASVCAGGTYAGGSAPNGEYFWWMKTTGGISGYGGNSSNSTWVTADGTLPDTTSWHFYCLWRDATDGKLRIQIDSGTPVVSSSVLTTVAQSTLNFVIGGANSGSFKADVGCSRWGYIKGNFLTSTEITWLRNSGSGRNWAEIKTLAGH